MCHVYSEELLQLIVIYTDCSLGNVRHGSTLLGANLLEMVATYWQG
jgi:hypothetical protein